jgi:hypothetical protein
MLKELNRSGVSGMKIFALPLIFACAIAGPAQALSLGKLRRNVIY